MLWIWPRGIRVAPSPALLAVAQRFLGQPALGIVAESRRLGRLDDFQRQTVLRMPGGADSARLGTACRFGAGRFQIARQIIAIGSGDTVEVGTAGDITVGIVNGVLETLLLPSAVGWVTPVGRTTDKISA